MEILKIVMNKFLDNQRNREPESKQIIDPLGQALQKWQRVGCLTSGHVNVNKHRLYGPLHYAYS